MPLKAISLYTGAGGLDLGLESAGFATLAAVEMDPDCVKTLRANRDWPVIDRSIHDIPSAELLTTARLEPGEADLLFGGPPCQPFSKAGYWASGDSRRLDDPRADTVAAFLRVLRDTRPRAFLMENVAGLAFRGKDEGLRLIQQTLESILELPAQAVKETTVLDLDGAARPGHRPLPLEEPEIVGERTLPPADDSR